MHAHTLMDFTATLAVESTTAGLGSARSQIVPGPASGAQWYCAWPCSQLFRSSSSYTVYWVCGWLASVNVCLTDQQSLCVLFLYLIFSDFPTWGAVDWCCHLTKAIFRLKRLGIQATTPSSVYRSMARFVSACAPASSAVSYANGHSVVWSLMQM